MSGVLAATGTTRLQGVVEAAGHPHERVGLRVGLRDRAADASRPAAGPSPDRCARAASRRRSSFPTTTSGAPTVSSIAVAHEVEAMGGRSIACLNSRDRNLLGLRRDLLTAAGVRRRPVPPRARRRPCGRRAHQPAHGAPDDRRGPGVPRCVGGSAPERSRGSVRSRPGSAKATSCSCRCRSPSTRSCGGAIRSRIDVPVVRGCAGARERAHGQGTGDRPGGYRHPVRPHRTARPRPRCGTSKFACEQVLGPPRTRGAVDGVHLVPVSALPRMSRPAWSATLS